MTGSDPEERDLPRILVLTLFGGEGEYEACKDSVRKQEGVILEHVCFEWLQNREAHEAVYQTIMARAAEFDAFLKLDADMVLFSEDALRKAYDVMQEVPNTDHLSIPVYDLPSGSFLMGMHLFSSRASWSFPLDPLFPDANPKIPGTRRIDSDLRLRIIDHMPAPSERQAFALGVHRASKIVQLARGKKRKPADFPLSYLKRVAINREFDRDLQLLILSGMFETLLGRIVNDQYKSIEANKHCSIWARIFARLYSSPILSQVIFQMLRLRYVYWRRLLNGIK